MAANLESTRAGTVPRKRMPMPKLKELTVAGEGLSAVRRRIGQGEAFALRFQPFLHR